MGGYFRLDQERSGYVLLGQVLSGSSGMVMLD
jgi:hypothetical protein